VAEALAAPGTLPDEPGAQGPDPPRGARDPDPLPGEEAAHRRRRDQPGRAPGAGRPHLLAEPPAARHGRGDGRRHAPRRAWNPGGATKCLVEGCPPAIWQQAAGSRFLRALNDGRDEAPGRVAYTTVRSATDEVVQPQTGPAPTSALRGASNVLIQGVCPRARHNPHRDGGRLRHDRGAARRRDAQGARARVTVSG
jgi:hypothetical protein